MFKIGFDWVFFLRFELRYVACGTGICLKKVGRKFGFLNVLSLVGITKKEYQKEVNGKEASCCE